MPNRVRNHSFIQGGEKIPHSSSIGFMKTFEEQKREEDLQLITDVERQVGGVLAEIQYIAKLLEDNKKMAPVEDLPSKIRKSYEKIKKLLNPENAAQQELGPEANKRTSGGIQLEENPLIKELGGMPLEEISPEWQEVIEGTILDKAELENLVNKKLKDRVELANKLKAQNKLTNQPKMKAAPGPAIKPQYEKLQQTLKLIFKEMPPPPTPTPQVKPPRPY